MITKESLTKELNHLIQQRESYQQLSLKADGAIQVLQFLLTQVETEQPAPAEVPVATTKKTRK